MNYWYSDKLQIRSGFKCVILIKHKPECQTLNTNRKWKVLYLRAAITRVDPFSFPNALVVWRHIVEAGVDVEHEEKIADGPNHSDGKERSVKF